MQPCRSSACDTYFSRSAAELWGGRCSRLEPCRTTACGLAAARVRPRLGARPPSSVHAGWNYIPAGSVAATRGQLRQHWTDGSHHRMDGCLSRYSAAHNERGRHCSSEHTDIDRLLQHVVSAGVIRAVERARECRCSTQTARKFPGGHANACRPALYTSDAYKSRGGMFPLISFRRLLARAWLRSHCSVPLGTGSRRA